jgi:predicted dehydrogenase
MSDQSNFSRRQFIGGALAMTAAGSLADPLAGRAEDNTAAAKATPPAGFSRKIKVGVIGGGHRGNFIGNFMKNHGGYEIHAVADYFPEVAGKLGENLGADKSRRFSGLSGYKKVIDSGVEALAVLDVPCFYPEQVTAAVAAGCHVYMAKPIAVDAPAAMAIGAAAQAATAKQRCLLVDYQLSIDPAISEVISRIRQGALGPIAHVVSFGKAGAWADPPKGPTIESRLRGWVWLSDIALGGDTIVSYDIHIIDGVIAAVGKRAASACGRSRICRPDPHGDRIDACGVVFEFDDGTLWTHVLQALNNNADCGDLTASILGATATGHFGYYGGKAYVRGGSKHFVGPISGGMYNEGAQRNVADFYRNIVEGRFDNATAKRAVDGTLTAILGREAAARRRYLTMDELLRENKKLEVDLTGLKS